MPMAEDLDFRCNNKRQVPRLTSSSKWVGETDQNKAKVEQGKVNSVQIWDLAHMVAWTFLDPWDKIFRPSGTYCRIFYDMTMPYLINILEPPALQKYSIYLVLKALLYLCFFPSVCSLLQSKGEISPVQERKSPVQGRPRRRRNTAAFTCRRCKLQKIQVLDRPEPKSRRNLGKIQMVAGLMEQGQT